MNGHSPGETMTCSDCWIEPIDDPDFALARRLAGLEPGRYRLGPPPQPYWINWVKDWAAARGLRLEVVGFLDIRVRVTRAQMLDFMQFVYGEAIGNRAAFIPALMKDGCSYWLYADEF